MRGQDPASMKRHGARVVPILLSLVCTGLCQTDCFGTLLALNNEMQTELIRIRNGATPNSEYLYNLCPNTFFDTASTALEPVLSNSKFVCGENGSRTDRCVMLGGSTQVRISDSLVEGYPLEELTFMGITFSGFQSNNNRRGSSIAAQASSVTTATFTDCEWQDFASDFVVQQNATGSFFGPMTVLVDGCSVLSGTAGAIFDNDGGLLRLNNLQVNGVTSASLVATANNGASFLEKSTVTASDLNTVTFTTAGGSQTVLASTVSSMNRIEDVFFVEDVGSTLLLDGVMVVENQVQTVPWNVVSARTKAIARVTETTISDNMAIEYGVVAFDASVTIMDSFISRNSGTAVEGTSAAVFGITDAMVNLERVEFTENSGFSAIVMSLIRSGVSIVQSCFQGGSSVFVVFIANDATFEESENFIDSLDSERCEAIGPRLFKEDDASGCFLGSGTCEGQCLSVSDQSSCLAQEGPTKSPTTAPTQTPTSSPMSAPTQSPIEADTVRPSLSPQSTPNATLSPTNAPIAPVAVPTAPTRMPSKKGPPIQTKAPKAKPPATKTPSSSPSISFSPTTTAQPTLTPTKTQMPSTSFVPSVSIRPSNTATPTYHEPKGKGGMQGKGGKAGSMMMMGKGSMMDGKGGMNSDKSSKMNGKGGKDGMDGKGSDKGGMKSVKGRPPAPRLEGGNATNTTSFGIGSSTLEDDDAREQFADVLHLTNVSSSNVTDSPVAIGSSNTLEDDGKNRTNAKDDKNVHKQFADVVLPTNSSDKVTNAAFGVGRSRTSEHNGENRTIERDYNNARKKVFVDVVLLTNSLGNVTNPTVESEKSSASEQDGEHKTIVKAGTAQTQFADVVLSTNSSGNRSSSSRSSVSESSARNADTTLRNDDGFDVKILDDDQPVALASGRNHDA